MNKHTVNKHWKIFGLNVLAILLVVVLQHLNLTPPIFPQQSARVISPLPINPGDSKVQQSTKDNVFATVLSKLEAKKNNFYLKKPVALIPAVQADGNYNDASSYAVIDYESGDVIFQKDMSKRVPIASLTKIMSAVVSLDLASPDELYTVSPHAASIQPTTIGVIPGQKLSLDELLHAALMTSANDSVQVIAEGIDQKYGEEVFVRAMNAKAQFLGLKNTHFTNPQGFDDQNPYSSSEDLLILSHYALSNYPLVSQIVDTQAAVLPQNSNHKRYDLPNWNGLLGVYPGTFGVKIGNTDAAMYTTVVGAQRSGKKLIAVLLGAPGVLQRDEWTAQLLDDAFSKSANLPPVGVSEDQLRAKYQSWYN